VGDGNFHCIIIADPGDPAEMEEAERLNQRVMRRALALDGTCTGEHGVGMHKSRCSARSLETPPWI
jgi:D-lactate dehydrogenase (cytochrome)